MNWIKIDNHKILNLNQVESLERNDYANDPEYYVIESEDYVIFSSESKAKRDEVWNKLMKQLKL